MGHNLVIKGWVIKVIIYIYIYIYIYICSVYFFKLCLCPKKGLWLNNGSNFFLNLTHINRF